MTWIVQNNSNAEDPLSLRNMIEHINNKIQKKTTPRISRKLETAVSCGEGNVIRPDMGITAESGGYVRLGAIRKSRLRAEDDSLDSLLGMSMQDPTCNLSVRSELLTPLISTDQGAFSKCLAGEKTESETTDEEKAKNFAN